MNSKVGRILLYWLPVAAWVGIICIESTDMMAANNTGHLLLAILTPLFGPIDPERFQIFHAVLRKTGHFIGYGILCLLFFRAMRATLAGTLRRWATLAIVFTCVVASLDELHQAFLPSRTGRLHDIVLDTCGAACMQLLLIGFFRRRDKRSEVSA
jgi:VanZ family protein